MSEEAEKARARRAAYRVGLVARKSRRYHPLENLGGFILIDPTMNIPVAGFKWDLTAEDVIEYCRDDD